MDEDMSVSEAEARLFAKHVEKVTEGQSVETIIYAAYRTGRTQDASVWVEYNAADAIAELWNDTHDGPRTSAVDWMTFAHAALEAAHAASNMPVPHEVLAQSLKPYSWPLEELA